MTDEPHRIDVHHHFIPADYREALAREGVEQGGDGGGSKHGQLPDRHPPELFGSEELDQGIHSLGCAEVPDLLDNLELSERGLVGQAI